VGLRRCHPVVRSKTRNLTIYVRLCLFWFCGSLAIKPALPVTSSHLDKTLRSNRSTSHRSVRCHPTASEVMPRAGRRAQQTAKKLRGPSPRAVLRVRSVEEEPGSFSSAVQWVLPCPNRWQRNLSCSAYYLEQSSRRVRTPASPRTINDDAKGALTGYRLPVSESKCERNEKSCREPRSGWLRSRSPIEEPDSFSQRYSGSRLCGIVGAYFPLFHASNAILIGAISDSKHFGRKILENLRKIPPAGRTC
jgi:hypothetical protein